MTAAAEPRHQSRSPDINASSPPVVSFAHLPGPVEPERFQGRVPRFADGSHCDVVVRVPKGWAGGQKVWAGAHRRRASGRWMGPISPSSAGAARRRASGLSGGTGGPRDSPCILISFPIKRAPNCFRGSLGPPACSTGGFGRAGMESLPSSVWAVDPDPGAVGGLIGVGEARRVNNGGSLI